ncbi:MAG TPA: hypothetical protein VF176_03770 [Solirubrobacterales bacterium]
MIGRAQIPMALVLTGVALVATGCQSTQDKSSEIAAELGPVAQEKGLRIGKENREVKVVSTTLLTDAVGSAVVVELHNDSGTDLIDAPILIDVLDAKGHSVYRNDIPGIEPALASVPFIPAGGDVAWVHDQILAVGKPDSVKVKVGAGAEPFTGEQPEVTVSEPKLEGDPISGLAAGGKVVNNSGEDQPRVLLYAIARKGDRIVAAGRGAVEHLKATGKPIAYSIFFIGDPKGAQLTVTYYPTLPGQEGA